MKAKPIVCKKAFFTSEGRLLQELGERLVASPAVALVELIKNAYDADSPICYVSLRQNKSELIIEDEGNGMTETDFLQNWMKVGTGSKLRAKTSLKYKRKLTGAKGIGRFAVRFLGASLTLITIAYDEEAEENRRLEVDFNWNEFDKEGSLEEISVEYNVYKAEEQDKIGTTLSISGLRTNKDVVFSKEVRTEVLKITEPQFGLEDGGYGRGTSASKSDPGFDIVLPTDHNGNTIEDSVASTVIKNFWGRVTIDHRTQNLYYNVYLAGSATPEFTHKQKFISDIKEGFFVDIRFFPKRPGLFSGIEVNGIAARTWVKKHNGVSIVDHGFRMKPYGYENDDWLHLAKSKAVNERDWQSTVMQEHFPIAEEIRPFPGRNPALNLPHSHQLIGAVFVHSSQELTKSQKADGLIPAADREGLLGNNAFNQLKDAVRGGVELLAWRDKCETERREQEEAELIAVETKGQLKYAIRDIQRSPTLTAPDKKRIINDYTSLSNRLDELDDYNRKAREGLETMALLGVVAGFMTHETRRIMGNLQSIIQILKKLEKKHPDIKEPLSEVEAAHAEFLGHTAYASTYVSAVQEEKNTSFKAVPQITRIIKTFKTFVEEKGVKVTIEGDSLIETPPLQIALYSGILLNLFTNALKAVMAGPADNNNPAIVFKTWNEGEKHIIEVADNGIGIPEHFKDRIWDPLFTTTSRLNNPLGSGMGLGLSLIRTLLRRIGGAIELIPPPLNIVPVFE